MSNTKTFNPLRTSKRRAFSLIELSIVLIIIGLLIAGITGGASLIKSASLRAAMGEARGYNVAVNSFYVQFDALPGDYATVISQSGTAAANNPATVAGNADGKIECVNSSNTAESANAWAALKNSGTIDTILTYNIPNTTVPVTFVAAAANIPQQVPGTNIPASKIKSAGWTFDYANSQNVVILTGTTAAAVAHTAGTANNGGAIATASITPNDALSIDTKMDDGVPTTGKVRQIITTNCYSGTTYTTSQTTATCAPSFQVDIT